ncbi:DUF5020 family protein [Bacteroides sp. 519]|uniref:nucleoside-specific channel-forming Tsx family protein n=1 Tax=Bacteroides sp. 519 TaxID=2302937 RepID=UPI0013D07B3F|nr:DUF5020 family protein [Bacteroides sp. 519]NDV57877.1 DUF5020 family protein [Bacteroides sp. 519]
MKKTLTLALLLCSFLVLNAQNIQFHYDFGSMLYDELDTRPKLTTTVEMFKPDKWGSTFFFVDMDYTGKGVASAYWEIARELKFWNGPISAHVEYNGGLRYIDNAFLFGPTYTYNSSDFSKGFSFTPMYKYIHKNSSSHNFQLTGTWYLHFAQQKLTFTGFVDFWREKNPFTGKEYIFLTEPQFWVNLNKFKGVDKDFNMSVGTEWELSNNFAARKGFYCLPTLAVKWTFN